MFKFRMWPVLATGVLVLGVGSYAIAHDESVEVLSCGLILTSNAKLGADLDCTGMGTDGLIILADKVTIDLNSFTIISDAGFNGVTSVGFNDVKIQNGTIRNGRIGVFVDLAEKVKLKNLLIRDTSNDGVRVSSSSGVEIENLSLFGPPRNMTGGRAIRFFAVDGFEIDNIDVHGYRAGVQIICIGLPGCLTDPARPNTDGKVTNSTFSDTRGVALFTARDVKISGNHVTDCTIVAGTGPGSACIGIVVGRSSEIEVENNYVHDNLVGIQLNNDVTDSEISANHVYDNIGNGIALVGNNPGATGNEIESNITFGNGIGNGTDLFHNVFSSPNKWKNNSCDTSFGADIPPCSP